MSQSTTLVAVLFAGFVIYATRKGSLRGYLNVLGLVN